MIRAKCRSWMRADLRWTATFAKLRYAAPGLRPAHSPKNRCRRIRSVVGCLQIEQGDTIEFSMYLAEVEELVSGCAPTERHAAQPVTPVRPEELARRAIGGPNTAPIVRSAGLARPSGSRTGCVSLSASSRARFARWPFSDALP